MGLYNQMKINNPPVVYNNEDYINLSIELANNKKKNKEIRDQIIENSNKFFFNNYLVINEFENFFISLYSFIKNLIFFFIIFKFIKDVSIFSNNV